MAKAPRRELAVGTLFALALVILALAVMAVGGESNLFRAKAGYVVVFPSADGLTFGSPVRMAGVQIGSVTSIRLPTSPTDTGIVVAIQIDESYAGRVRQDSGAKLRTLMYLSGEKFVELTPGSPDKPELAQGSQVPLLAGRELLEQGDDIAENLIEITVSLNDILGRLERGEGLIGEMLADPDFGKEGLEALRGSLENVERLTGDLLQQRARGFEGGSLVGRVLYDEAFGAKLDGLGQAIDDLAAVTGGLRRQEGALGELLRDDGSAEQAIADLRDAAGSLKQVTARLESPTGLVGRLLNDEVYSEAVATDLRDALHHLAEITGKIDRGEGTLGALVNERTLHEGAEEIVAGVNDSKFARWLTRHYRKKGIKAQTTDEPIEHNKTPSER